MHKRFIQILIITILLSFSSYAYSLDVVTDVGEEDGEVALNEEMRKLDVERKANDTDIATNVTNIATNETDISTNATSITNAQSIDGWANITYSGGTPTLADSYNVTSIADSGTGYVTITWDTDFANTNYACIPTAEDTTGLMASVKTKATGTTGILISNDIGAAADPDIGVSVIAIGDQ